MHKALFTGCGRKLDGSSLSRYSVSNHEVTLDMPEGPVAGLVGIEGGVVSEVINLESSGVGAPDRRPRHDQQYHEDAFSAVRRRNGSPAFRRLVRSERCGNERGNSLKNDPQRARCGPWAPALRTQQEGRP